MVLGIISFILGLVGAAFSLAGTGRAFGWW